jgi:hypothetical protein
MSVTQMPGKEPSVEIRETFMRPTPDWPEGGYLLQVAETVEIATGYYATIYPDKPSPYYHGKAPAVVMWELGNLPWNTPGSIATGIAEEITNRMRAENPGAPLREEVSTLVRLPPTRVSDTDREDRPEPPE